jgi:hypothetical protein
MTVVKSWAAENTEHLKCYWLLTFMEIISLVQDSITFSAEELHTNKKALVSK